VSDLEEKRANSEPEIQPFPITETKAYANHDFSKETHEGLVTIIQDLRKQLSLSESQRVRAEEDRDRFFGLVEKTNESLLTLKVHFRL